MAPKPEWVIVATLRLTGVRPRRDYLTSYVDYRGFHDWPAALDTSESAPPVQVQDVLQQLELEGPTRLGWNDSGLEVRAVALMEDELSPLRRLQLMTALRSIVSFGGEGLVTMVIRTGKTPIALQVVVGDGTSRFARITPSLRKEILDEVGAEEAALLPQLEPEPEVPLTKPPPPPDLLAPLRAELVARLRQEPPERVYDAARSLLWMFERDDGADVTLTKMFPDSAALLTALQEGDVDLVPSSLPLFAASLVEITKRVLPLDECIAFCERIMAVQAPGPTTSLATEVVENERRKRAVELLLQDLRGSIKAVDQLDRERLQDYPQVAKAAEDKSPELRATLRRALAEVLGGIALGPGKPWKYIGYREAAVAYILALMLSACDEADDDQLLIDLTEHPHPTLHDAEFAQKSHRRRRAARAVK